MYRILLGDYLYSIKLVPGEKNIEMRYDIEYLTAGIIASICGILLLLAQCIIRWRKVFIG